MLVPRITLILRDLNCFYTNTLKKWRFFSLTPLWEKSCFTTTWKHLRTLQWLLCLFVFNAEAPHSIHPSIHQRIKWHRKQCRFSFDPVHLLLGPLRWKGKKNHNPPFKEESVFLWASVTLICTISGGDEADGIFQPGPSVQPLNQKRPHS